MYALAIDRYQYAGLRWKPAQRLDNTQLPARTRAWLLDEGSLTARLIEASGNRFAVRVLGQYWARPLPQERRALGMRAHEVALVREVALACAGEPWVCARSILPARSLRGELHHLRRFGARSLGAKLFAQPGLHREGFEVARMVLPDTTRLWARRSVFHLRGKPLLVQEVFLPACRLGWL